MPLAAHEFDGLVKKFGFETKHGSHLYAWLTVNGKLVVRTRRSNKSKGDLPSFYSIRRQLMLNDRQLRDAIRCTLDRDSYLEILRRKGLLAT